MHDVIKLSEPPEEINAGVVRRLEALYREEIPLSRARPRPSRRWPPAGRSGCLLEPAS